MKSKIRRFSRIISLLLAIISCIGLFACDKTPNKPTPSQGTGKYVVENSTSNYTILMPEIRDKNLNIAVSELQFGIEKATGYKMTTTTKYVEGGKYLSVGKTPLYELNKTAVDGDGLEHTEVRVLTVGDNVIMVGGEGEYTVYAVYDFMEVSFGFKWFSDEDYYCKETNKIELLDLNSTDKPEMQMRCLYQWNYEQGDHELKCRRLRVHSFNEFHFISAGHNMIGTVIPKSMYANKHPEWFTRPTGGLTYGEAGQLCVCNPELVEEFIRRTKQLIEENWGDGSKKYFMIGMEDDWGQCECEEYCKPRLEINGNHAGNYIEFANTVSREINEWVKEKDPNKTIYFPMYAYFYTEEAPVKMVNGKYVPFNDNVVPDPEVIMMMAPLNNSFTYAFDDPRNTKTYQTLQKWHAITEDNFMMYSYSYTGSHMFPMNDLVTMGGSIAQGIENDYFGWIEEDGTYFRFPVMQPLKSYVRANLWWGTDKSVDELAYEFIDFYYGPVAKQFKQYYMDLKQWQSYQMENFDIFISILGNQYETAQNWPINIINKLDSQLIGMIDSLEYLKNVDKDLYNKYYAHVNTERLFTNYAYCTLYNGYFNDTDNNAMVDFLLKYMQEYRVQCHPDRLNSIESYRR